MANRALSWIFPVVMTLFSLLEVYAACACLLDFRGYTFEGALPGGLIRTIYMATRDTDKYRAYEFMSLWVGSNKMIMVLLLAVITFLPSRDAVDRHTKQLATSMVMIAAPGFYFALGLDASMRQMEEKGELRELGAAEQVAGLMKSVLLPLFAVAVMAEGYLLYDARTQSLAKKDVKID